MNAFEDACQVEAESLAILEPYLAAKSDGGKYVRTAKGRLAKELQRTYGDVLMQGAEGAVYAVELKAEQANKYGNVFLEEWSNRSRYKRGWMEDLRVDFLLYHFIESDELLVFDFQALKRWAYCCEKGQIPNLYKYPMKPQGARNQMNDTWGVCVPISQIPDTVLVRRIKPSSFTEVKALSVVPSGSNAEWVSGYERESAKASA